MITSNSNSDVELCGSNMVEIRVHHRYISPKEEIYTEVFGK